MASRLPAPAPERTPETDEFWDATADGSAAPGAL